jgi:hypothetical protein
LALIVSLGGCSILSRTEVQQARLEKMPEEIGGCMRLVQGTVKVNVIGTEKIGEFKVPGAEVKQAGVTVEAPGYIIVHERDLATLLRNTARLNKILKDPDTSKAVKDKGL